MRGDGRTDECGAKQGRRPVIRFRRGIDRHFVGDCGRRGDFRRAGADHRVVSRGHSDRAYRQGSARRRADHAHHPGRRREDGSRRGLAIAAGRRAGLSRRHPDCSRADRTLARAPPRAAASLGVVARTAGARHSEILAVSRSPALRRAARQRRRAASANAGSRRSSIDATRRPSFWLSRSGCSDFGRGPTSGRDSTIRSRSCWRFPRSRCWRSASPS